MDNYMNTKHNFTQDELITLSNGVVSLIEMIDTECAADTKQNDYINKLKALHTKICKMIKVEE